MYETDEAALAGWLTIDEAARVYGVSPRTIRRRLARNELDAGHVITNKGKEWRIRPPRPPSGATATGTQPPDQALIPVSAVQQLMAPYLQERDELRQERDTLSDKITRLQEARLADAEEVGRLRGRMEALEAELARLRSDSTPTPPAAGTTVRRRWPWQR